MKISKAEFLLPRTPKELTTYVDKARKYIFSNPSMLKAARLNKEPYKTFSEELVPFSAFCTWKYGDRTDVFCSLVPGTPGRDAIIQDKRNKSEHSVEITFPIDGKFAVNQGRQLNEKGRTELQIWDYHDLNKQKEIVEKVLDTANKKALRDYRYPGGSTLLFVFDHSMFWDDNQKHVDLLNSLIEKLKRINLKADTVLFMCMPGEKVIVVKSTEPVTGGDS